MISFALCANLRVLRVSEKLVAAGEILAIMQVLELPPRESFSRKVSLESLYLGILGEVYLPDVLVAAFAERIYHAA